jgi:curved DNA-binding protein
MEYYSILGIDNKSSQEDIKKAYKKLAMKYHPDRNSGDDVQFKKIQEAYDTLGDPIKRQQYDNPQPQFDGFRQYSGFPPGFEDMMSQIFVNNGGGFTDLFGRRAGPARNRIMNLQADISLEDAFYGKTLTANVNLPSGRNQTLEIKIPPGIRSGNTLRLANMGDDSISNVPRGDIHLTVNVLEHPRFTRENDDLKLKMDITFFDAILGKRILITTIEGKILETEIPSGFQPGQMLNLQGYGMPNISNQYMRGRLLVEFNFKTPILTEEQKEQLKKIIN